jgi:hypothetical protein
MKAGAVLTLRWTDLASGAKNEDRDERDTP